MTNAVDDIWTQHNERRNQIRDLIEENKMALLQALKDTKITEITAQYIGGGDEGDIEEIEVCEGKQGVDAPTVKIPIKTVGYSKQEIETATLVFDEAIKEFCFNLLQIDHAGWEINEGSDGTFRFLIQQPDSIKIELEHRQNFMTTETTEQEW